MRLRASASDGRDVARTHERQEDLVHDLDQHRIRDHRASQKQLVACQIGASMGTALLSTIAASATASYLAASGAGGGATAAVVHGFTTATAWAAVVLVVGAVLVGLLVSADPRREHARA